MVDYIQDYVRRDLSNQISPLKLRLNAPIIANYEQTLSLKIDLQTGKSELSLNKTGFSSSQNSSPATTVDSDSNIDDSIPFEPIVFNNLIEMRPENRL